MTRAQRRQMINLMPATGARGNDNGAKRLLAHFLGQRFSHFERKFIFGAQRAKSASHAAATGVQQSHTAFRQSLRQTLHENRIHQRFYMAVRVDDNLGSLGLKLKRSRFLSEDFFDELLEQEATFDDSFCSRQVQFAIILDKHRVAGGLEKNDRRVVHVQVQQREVVLAESRGLVEVSLAESGPATTSASDRQHHFEAERFENFDRGN